MFTRTNNLRRLKFQRGFTLIEVLVVISIIGVLAGLLLPAIQQARETARRMQCQSHLRQIGIALLNYHDSKRSFPPGYISKTDSAGNEIGPGWGWASRILPELEQSSLFEKIDFGLGIEHASNIAVRLQRVPLYLCPSDPAPNHWRVVKRNLATGAFLNNICDVASANYIGMFGTFEPGVDGDGAFFRNDSVGLRDLLDGTSTTLLIGERSFQLGEATWTGAITDAVIIPDGSDGVGTGPPEAGSSIILGHSGDSFSPGENRSHVNQFYSHHRGGVHFLLADGHVAFFSNSLDNRTYRALTTRAGSEVVSDDF